MPYSYGRSDERHYSPYFGSERGPENTLVQRTRGPSSTAAPEDTEKRSAARVRRPPAESRTAGS